jgi:O-antigen/teichoic acid export membrane protein
VDLRTRAIKSTAWYVGTRLWTQVLSWAVTIVLARLLAPSDYGLFGMAFSVIVFLEMFHEFGLGMVIVQRQELTRQQLNTIFWVVIGISLVTASAGFAAAPAIAGFYAEPRLTWIVRALALMLLVNAFGMVSYSLLTKEIDFRRRSLGEAMGVLASTATSLTLALHGQGVWALVLGELARTVVRNVTVFTLCGWRPGLDCAWRGMRSVFGFGANVVGASFVGHCTGLATTAVLGRLLGPVALGLYSMSSNLASNSVQKLSMVVINQMSFPVFSRVQSEPDRLRRYFLTISRYTLMAVLPLQVGMLLVAHDFVRVVLTERWMAIAPLLQIQCLGSVWGIVGVPAATALNARGRADTMFRFTLISSLLHVVACAGAAPFGVTWVVAGWAASHCLTRSLLVGLALRELSVPASRYVENASAPLLATVAMVTGVLAVQLGLPSHGASPAVTLARDAVVGAMCYLGALALADRSIAAEVRSVLRTLGASRA